MKSEKTTPVSLTLPEAEFLVMNMAKIVGIKTVPFALIKQGENYAYITKRIDRIFPGKKGMKKLDKSKA